MLGTSRRIALFFNFISLAMSGVSILLIATGAQLVRIDFLGFTLSAIITIVSPILMVIGMLIYLCFSVSVIGLTETFRKFHAALLFIIPIFIFLLVSGLSLFATPISQGFQNFLAFCLFGLGSIFFSLFIHTTFHRALLNSILIAAAFFSFASIFLNLFSSSFIDNRSFAITSVVALAALIPFANKNYLFGVVSGLIFIAILFSASRIATFAALLIIGFAGFQFGISKLSNLLRMFFIYILASVATVVSYLFLPRVKDRVEIGDQAVVLQIPNVLSENPASDLTQQVTPVFINTNGRIGAWKEFLSTINSPTDIIFGQGIGSSAKYGQENITWFPQVLNEYLRIYLDSGVLGVIAFIVMVLLLVLSITKPMSGFGKLQLAGILTIVVLLVTAVTDGPFIYPFTTLPAALIIGMSLNKRTKEVQQFLYGPKI